MKILFFLCLLALGLASGAFAGPASDFSMTATSSSHSVAGGGDVSYPIRVVSTVGVFTQPVTLAAQGLPPGATVTFSPATVIPGADYASTTMTIHTVAEDSSDDRRASTGLPYAPLLAGLWIIPLGIRRARPRAAGCAVVMLAVTLLQGCETEGAAVPLSETVASQATYVVTVLGSSGSVQHSITVELTVQTGSGLNT